MATQKTNRKKPTHSRARSTPKAQNNAPKAKSKPIRDAEYVKQRNQISAILIFALSILMACLVIIAGDHLWLWTHNVLLGLFGTCAIAWPILLCYISLVTAFERQNNRMSSKVIMIIVIITFFCASVYIFSDSENVKISSFWAQLGQLYTLGIKHAGAGLFSGLIGIPFVAALGAIGAKIVIILCLFVSIMILTGTSLVQLFSAITKPADRMAANISNAREQRTLARGARANANIDIALDEQDELPQHPVQSPGKQPQKQIKNKKIGAA